MSQKLYLMEFLISKIKVDAATVSVPTYDNIKLQIRCAQFLYVDIVTDEFSVEGLDAGMKPPNGEFLVKIGKTYLFSFNASALADELQNSPMIIDLLVVRQTEGTGKFNWPQTFIDLSTQSTGSINQEIILDLYDVNNRKIGSIDLNIKFSCIGNSLETNFALQNRQAQFVNPVTKAQFKLERFELPETGVSGKEVGHSDSKISWFELYGGKGGGSKISTVPIIPLDDIGFHQSYGKKPADGVSHQSGWDIVSIVFRPPENKFFDFLQILSVEVDENQSEKMKNVTTTFEEEVDPFKSSIHNTDTTNTELYTELINKYICKNKNCPVAQKFKDYGIGTLAVAQGMGTLYKKVTNNKCYGLSNTYGVFTNYGPYGVFKKNPDYPFFPPRSNENIEDDEDTDQPITIKPCPPCSNEKENTCQCCGKFCRLRGGGILDKHSFGRLLRLRGGGLSANVETLIYLASQPTENMLFCNGCSLLHENRLRGGGGAGEERPAGLKSAMIECKPVMDQFDEILQNYRNALGPCGTATCPFSQNMVERICKQVCYLDPKDQCTCSPTAECQNNPCTLEKCPYKEKQNAKYPAGCGSPKCAYAQHKLGLVDDDAAMELALLPPPMIGNCGHPKCDYPSANLPPIHWDCPDPLPQDVCKNPNCPHQPKELADIKVKNKKTPCCSQNCPYALPPPCDLPSCPFRQKPCPYLSKKKEGDKNPCCDMESSEEEEEDDEVCANPACPFAKKTDGSEGCSNPLCPYGKKKNPKKKKAQGCCECKEQQDPEEEFCDSPECPMNLKKKSINKSSTNDNCNNPSCPGKPPKGNKDDACDNPSCPFAKDNKSPKDELCDNPKCPYKSKANDGDSGCSSPECPFTKGKKNTSQISLESESLCDNPECPFRSGGPGLSKEHKDQSCDDCDNSVCSNPECPQNKLNSKEDKIKPKDYCDNPQCPFSKEFQDAVCIDPFCPYSQPLPSCGIPNCPYEQKPQLFCPSPICPSKFNSVQPQQTASVEPKPRKVSNAGDATSEGRRGSGKRGSASSQNKKPQTPPKEVIYKENENSSNKKQKSRFVYSVGDQYPGVKIGHRECKVPRFLVPAKMGWLWCIPPPWPMWKFPRKGWRPGAIEKSIAARIKAHRESKGLGMLMLPDFGKGGKKRRGGGESDDDLNIKPKPTLHITKKDGAYLITMNPLKDPFSLAENEDPYMECSPMQFKITKNKQDDADALCQCNDDAKSSSSDSELDIEFTPPAGIIHPDRFKKKRNVIHCESQYNPADFADKKAAKKDKGDKGTKKAKSEKGGKKNKKK